MGGSVSKILGKVEDEIKDIGRKIDDEILQPVKDGVVDFAQEIGDVAEDVVTSPLGQIAISVAFPTYAPYINAAAKVATGQKLDAYDFVALGVQGYSDIQGGKFKVDPKIQKAAKAAARIADGADAKTVLIGEYGKEWIKDLGIDTQVKTAVSDIVGEDNYNWLQDNIDFEQASADLIAGEQPLRMLSNQFGDDIANYIGGEDPNLQALGYAGIRTAVGLDEGLSPEKALLRGAKEYHERGGKLPEFDVELGNVDFDVFGNIADSINLDLSGLDLGITDYFKNIDLDLPDLLPKYGWQGLSDLDIDWKKFDLSGYDIKDFGDMSLPDIKDLGIDLKDINLDLPKLALAMRGREMEQVDQAPEEEEDILARTTDNELLAQDEGTPFSRQVLERTL